MNEDPADFPPTDEETPIEPVPAPTILSQVEDFIRRHPMASALATVGFGCAVGVAARELLTPPPAPRNRVVQLLEDIQGRLSEFAEPAYDRASHLADEGAHAVKRGAQRLRHLFS
jgi:ElaB/YqjD/DUF883 family membrane-anchored ribosome-binding protein